MTWIAVALGGALGSMARHLVNMELAHRLERSVPHATFVVNVVGCFIIGALSGWIASGKLTMTPTMRTFVFVGVLGGFTTFSALATDTFTMLRDNQPILAAVNSGGQLIVGIVALWTGYFVAAL